MGVGLAEAAVVILSFPHNPTTACIDLATMSRLVDFAREHGVVLVHDFAYSDTAFDGYSPALDPPGPRRVRGRGRALHAHQVILHGGLADRLPGRQRRGRARRSTKLKSYLDYGTFQPIQIASIVAMNEAPDYPKVVNEIYQHRRDALCEGLARIGWEVRKPKGTMFVWAPIPEPYRELGSLEFAKLLVRRRRWRRRPGSVSARAATASSASP